MRDERWGQTPVAVVLPKEGEKLTVEEVVEHCKEKIASYKKPTKISSCKTSPMVEPGRSIGLR